MFISEQGGPEDLRLRPLLDDLDEAIHATAGEDITRYHEVREMAYTILDHAEIDAARSATALPGAQALLDLLTGSDLLVGICTRNSSAAVHEAFDTLDLDLPRVIVGRGDLPNEQLKPDPRHPLYVLEMLDPAARPEEACLVGDATIDIMAANSAGMMSILVGGAEPDEEHPPDLCVDDLVILIERISGI